MHTDIFEEVWAPYTLVYKELWYHLQQATKEYLSEDYPIHRITMGLLPGRVVSRSVQAHIASYEYEG